MIKKLFVCMAAVCGLMFCSCTKNPAEKYAGTYQVKSDVNYTPQGMAKAGISTQEEGSITITLIGEDGQVSVSGMFNTTGHVNSDGVLYLDNEQHMGAALGAGVTFLGYDLANVSFTTDLHHGVITLNEDGTMNWTSSGTGVATVYVLGIGVDVNASVTYTNVANREM